MTHPTSITDNQNGFGVVEILLVTVIVGLIGFAGWRFYSTQDSAAPTADSTSQTTPAGNDVPTVNDSEDLKNAEDFMNDANIDEELSTSELDEALTE